MNAVLLGEGYFDIIFVIIVLSSLSNKKLRICNRLLNLVNVVLTSFLGILLFQIDMFSSLKPHRRGKFWILNDLRDHPVSSNISFRDEERIAQRSQATCPKSHSELLDDTRSQVLFLCA